MVTRKCGDCQLCCKLLPVRELAKPANTRCRHQHHHKGCGVYGKEGMPPSCRLWNCRWILGDDTDDLSRPNRSGYVIDVMPDFITIRNDLTGALDHLPVLQIWVDPARPSAWRGDKAFREYLVRQALGGMAALIRAGSNNGLVVFAPPLTDNGQWFEQQSNVREETHTLDDAERAGFSVKIDLEERL